MLSERGRDGKSYISSKRVMGVFITIIVMGCTIWLVWKEGGTSVVENLLQTALIIAASLLGISSVTGIWKGNSMTINDKHESSQNIKEKEIPKCPYIEKGTE